MSAFHRRWLYALVFFAAGLMAVGCDDSLAPPSGTPEQAETVNVRIEVDGAAVVDLNYLSVRHLYNFFADGNSEVRQLDGVVEAFTHVFVAPALLEDGQPVGGRTTVELTESGLALAADWDAVSQTVSAGPGGVVEITFMGTNPDLPPLTGATTPIPSDGSDLFDFEPLRDVLAGLSAGGDTLTVTVPVQWDVEPPFSVSWEVGGDVTLDDGEPGLFSAIMRSGDGERRTVITDRSFSNTIARQETVGSAESDPMFIEAPVSLGPNRGEFVATVEGQTFALSALRIQVYIFKDGETAFQAAHYTDVGAFWDVLNQ